jgi:dipeptidyl-peptidase-4
VDGAAITVPGSPATFYLANAPDPAERHVFRLAASGVQPLTTRPGTYAPFVSPDGRSLALLFSDDVTPAELYLASAERATELRRVTHSPPADFATRPWVRPRYVSFPSRHGGSLRARIIEPPGLDRSRKHPVVFGPVYSNTVRNRWGGLNAMLQQHLAMERGYIVVQVDVRGSTGYGRAFREAFLMDWGGHDLDDLEDAVAYLRTLGYADTDRMGMWGSSYGGTLGVYMLLRKPGLFKAAVAGAPATDPRYFGSDDVAIARRPQSHPETFRRGAAQYASNLRDHLLIIHGMMDDVVPFQTTVHLAEELMRQGKDFDVAFAPTATHGWTQRPYHARYLLRKLVDHFDRYLR